MRESAASLRTSLHAIESQSLASGGRSIDASLGEKEDGAGRGGGGGLPSPSAAGPDQKTLAVLSRLEYLDTVKSGMEATLAILQEAESWSTLEAEITSLLTQNSHLEAAQRLAESSKFVTLFTPSTAEYETRRSLLVSLQNQLEASLSAALVKAVAEKDAKACRTYWEIFGMIQREDEFRGYYYGSRRGRIVDQWANARLLDGARSTVDDDQSPSPVLFADFLASTFYGELKTLIQEESTFLPLVFPDPIPTLSSLIQSIIDNLNPSIGQRLESLVEHHGSDALPLLIKAYQATESTAAVVQTTMDKLTSTAKPPNSPVARSPATAAHGRRDSRRLSAYSISIPRGGSVGSLDGGAPGGSVGVGGGGSMEPSPWEASLYEPFLDFQADYTSLERRFVLFQIEQPKYAPLSSGGAEGVDLARSVWEKWTAVLHLLDEALRRSEEFTHGYGSTGYVDVANEAMSFFLARTGKVVQSKTARKAPNRVKVASDDIDDNEDLDELNYDGMDYTQEDLSTFQLALHLLGTCKSMSDRLGTFEKDLVGALTVAASRFVTDRDEPGKRALEGSTTTRGAIGLLQQSTLNSKELHDLFDSLHIGAPPPSGTNGRPSLPGASSSSGSFSSHLRTPSFFPQNAGATLSPSTTTTNGHSSSSFHSSFPPVSRPPPALLQPARVALGDFIVLTQSFLQQTVLGPLLHLLSTYPSLSVFRSAGQKKPTNVPTFSLSPTETISRVGEGLLNLPRLFEVYAVDDALSYSIDTLPFLPSELVSSSTLGSVRSTAEAISPSERSPLSSPGPGPVDPSKSASTNLSAERVTALHLRSLTSTLLAHLLSTTLSSFPVLPPSGVEQLATDLSYLGNVVRSVEVDWKEGEELVGLLGKEEGALRVLEGELGGKARKLRGVSS